MACALCLLLCACAPAPPDSAEQSNSPPDLSDMEALAARYLYPIVYSNATQMDWQKPSELEPWQFIAMYAFAEVWDAEIPESALVYEEGEPYYYEEQARVEDYIGQYFDLPAAYLRESDWYRPDQAAYAFGMVSGVGFAYDPEVLQADYDPARRELALWLSDGFGESELPASLLTLRLEEDGGFRCLGNELL